MLSYTTLQIDHYETSKLQLILKLYYRLHLVEFFETLVLSEYYNECDLHLAREIGPCRMGPVAWAQSHGPRPFRLYTSKYYIYFFGLFSL